ncbi:MAG TPA: hypothetical protein VMN57_12920 [Anaerolineales bacterium]|nr:hypothetical protein [Anaerolineales bacterium]
MKNHVRIFTITLSAVLLLSACSQAVPPTPITIVETVVVTEILGDQIVEVVVTNTLPPEKSPVSALSTLVVCLGAEPDTLYINGGSMLVASHVWEAIYDGPIDSRSFDYQAVILEKLPSLADGGAVIQSVEVAPGELFVDADGLPATLEPGVVYRPGGCRSDDCAQTYAAGDGSIELDQMVVTFKLLPSLLWSDGAPLTAADSVYHWNLDADPDTPQSKFLIERSAAYEALDEVFAQRQDAPAGARLRLDDHNFVPGLVEFPGGRQPGEAGAQDEHPLFGSPGREGSPPAQREAGRTGLRNSTIVHGFPLYCLTADPEGLEDLRSFGPLGSEDDIISPRWNPPLRLPPA